MLSEKELCKINKLLNGLHKVSADTEIYVCLNTVKTIIDVFTLDTESSTSDKGAQE